MLLSKFLIISTLEKSMKLEKISYIQNLTLNLKFKTTYMT